MAALYSLSLLMGGVDLRFIAIIVTVEPFANVIGRYTCHDRDVNIVFNIAR